MQANSIQGIPDNEPLRYHYTTQTTCVVCFINNVMELRHHLESIRCIA